MYNKSFNPDGGEGGDLGVARRNARLRTSSFFTRNSERIFREEDNRGEGHRVSIDT